MRMHPDWNLGVLVCILRRRCYIISAELTVSAYTYIDSCAHLIATVAVLGSSRLEQRLRRFQAMNHAAVTL